MMSNIRVYADIIYVFTQISLPMSRTLRRLAPQHHREHH